MMESSEICKFYADQNILITGGTGFMGKVLIEKLLRSTDVATVYLLIREKKEKNVHARLDDLFDNVIFETLKKERPKFRHRVVAIAGDCLITGLGLTIIDRQRLLSEVNIVFHVAATVRFDENLKLSYSINVNATSYVVELCRQLKNLKSLIHVSTAYCNCYMDSIDEKIYDYSVDYEKLGTLLEKMTKNEAQKLTPRIIGKWPNTYTFTKALAESLIKNTAGSLPVGIFRPSIVISSYKEPLECWVDNLYGPTGAVAGAGSGLVRVFPCNEEKIADLVPVDTCVAGVIASAWDVAKRTDRSEIPVYNYVSSVENCITWGEFNALVKIHGIRYPLQKAIWTIQISSIKNLYYYLFLRILLHTFPALLLDFLSIITGGKPRLMSMYGKIHKLSDVLAYFCTREWTFTNENVKKLWGKMNKTDRTLFPLSMKTVYWTNFLRNYFVGVRVHLLKDSLSTLEEARARKRKFDIAHHFIIFLFNFIAVSLIWLVILKVNTLFGGTSSSAQNMLINETNTLYT